MSPHRCYPCPRTKQWMRVGRSARPALASRPQTRGDLVKLSRSGNTNDRKSAASGRTETCSGVSILQAARLSTSGRTTAPVRASPIPHTRSPTASRWPWRVITECAPRTAPSTTAENAALAFSQLNVFQPFPLAPAFLSMLKTEGRASPHPIALLPAVAAAATTAAATIPPAATAAKFSGLGLVDFELRPLRSLPSNSEIALVASPELSISTKPKPLDWPENLSDTTAALATFPTCEKSAFEVIVRHRVGEVAYIQFAGHCCPPYLIAGKSADKET